MSDSDSGDEISYDYNETIISIERNPIVYNENHIDGVIDAISRGKTKNWGDCNIVNNGIVCNLIMLMTALSL